MYRPPKNDHERIRNLIEALSEPEDDDDADEAMRADLARRGLTLETWAAQWEARGQAVIDRSRRARRVRAVKIGAGVAVGLCAAAGAVLASQAMRGLKGGVEVQQTIQATPPATQPDAGRSAPKRR
jgi:hypothetical protein